MIVFGRRFENCMCRPHTRRQINNGLGLKMLIESGLISQASVTNEIAETVESNRKTATSLECV